MKITNQQDFLKALETKGYTDVGGYPLAFITSDGEVMSFESAKANQDLICEAIEDKSNCGWRVVACDVLWEGEHYCCHSNKKLQTAYGE